MMWALLACVSVAPEGGAGSRWMLTFEDPPGARQRQAIAALATVEAPMAGGWLVSAEDPTALDALPGLTVREPLTPALRTSPAIAVLRGDEGEVIAVLHLFRDVAPEAVAEGLRAQGLNVTAAGAGRVVLLLDASEVVAHRAAWAADDRVAWVARRPRRGLLNDSAVWVGQSGLGGDEATPFFDAGLLGQGQRVAVFDTGVDIDSCYFWDGALPAINRGVDEVAVDLTQRSVAAVNFLWEGDEPDDPLTWDDHSHGTHVAGIVAGDHPDTPGGHDYRDGMAPGAQLIIQDGGYEPSVCSDLRVLGCPTPSLAPFFQQAYDQGARVHTNSWGENGEDLVNNVYLSGARDADAFLWDHPDMLIVFAAGNSGPAPGTVLSPGVAKNILTVGATERGDAADTVTVWSSRGPTSDGRIKPDVVFPGDDVVSALSDFDVESFACEEVAYSGTSMAAPGAAGMAALVRQYFVDGFHPSHAPSSDGFEPSGALVKAALIHAAVPMDNATPIPSREQGWGRIQLDSALLNPDRDLRVEDQAGGFLEPDDAPHATTIEVREAGPLKVTLAWTDYAASLSSATQLVNDLDLTVTGPEGQRYLGNVFAGGVSEEGGDADRLNNVEQVWITAPPPGVWTVTVAPFAVPEGPQDFALVVSAAANDTSTPEDTASPDTDTPDTDGAPEDTGDSDDSDDTAVSPPIGDTDAPEMDEAPGKAACGCTSQRGGAAPGFALLLGLALLVRRRR